MMKIAVAADHAGFGLKQSLMPLIEALGHEVIDLGTGSEQPVDYPDYAHKLSLAIIAREAARGILVCGSGVGACVAANKIPGIRAGLCHDTYSARQGVEHDNMNVLCLGSRVIGEELAKELCRVFLGGDFSNEPRHVRRLEKLSAIERHYLKSRGTAKGTFGE